MEHKECTKCGETQHRSEFTRLKTSRDGLHAWCKGCRRYHANRMVAECVNSRPAKRREPRYLPTAWILPADPRCFVQRRIARLQHDFFTSYPAQPKQNISHSL